jgi:hypothetical protein
MIRRLAGWALFAFAVFYIATDPTGAAHVAHSALNELHQAGTSLATFVSRL